MPNSIEPSELPSSHEEASFGASVGYSSLAKGWKRWRRHLRCMVSAYVPEVVVNAFAYTPQQTARANWDAEYAGGHWDYLRGSSEIARYGIIASFCHCYSRGGALLDHGCGEGILRRHLNLDMFSNYVGVDLSLDAIAKADRNHGGKRTCFMVGNVEHYEPEQKFDVIVFNEMLYYLNDPDSVLHRYRDHMNPNGVFVVSMFDMIKARKVWQMLDKNHRLVESSRAVNQGGHSWTIRVYQQA